MTNKELETRQQAIDRESRPLLGKGLKLALIANTLILILGAVLAYLKIYISYFFIIGSMTILIITALNMPVPWDYANEEFHRQTLRTSTVATLRASLSIQTLNFLEEQKKMDTQNCLRVGSLFYLLTIENDAREKSRFKTIAENQATALNNYEKK